MGLFSKLFSKKPKEEPEEKKDGRIYFDSPYCKFLYDVADCEKGYEGEIKGWYTEGREYEKNIDIFFYADTPEYPESSPEYKTLEKYISDRDRTDNEVKKIVADYFLFKPDFITEGLTEEELMATTRIMGIYVYKEEVLFSLDAHNIYAEEIDLVFNSDGSKELRYMDYDHQKYCDKL